MMAIPSFVADEHLVLDAYFTFRGGREVDDAYDRLAVPKVQNCTRRDAAVGQVLVQSFQDRLPNYGIWMDGRMEFGRKPRKRARKTPSLVPIHLFTINWADSAPGLSWPEAYHAVLVPGYERYVVIASRDGADAFGCTDHAIGFFGTAAPVIESAGEIIRSYWEEQSLSWDQSPWEYLFGEGLVRAAVAKEWRAMIWESTEEGNE